MRNMIKFGTLKIIDASGSVTNISKTDVPCFTMRLHSKSIKRKLLMAPMLSLGEGYMHEDITIEGGSIFDFLSFLDANIDAQSLSSIHRLFDKLSGFFRFIDQYNPIHLAKKRVAHHYDLSNELFELFLDRDWQYSCAYFKNKTDNLEKAQDNKKKHIASKLLLKKGQNVLDIGSGWGGLALYLAKEFGVHVRGLTLSENQYSLAKKRAKGNKRVEFCLKDYRQEHDSYDCIVSVGMFEHVGTRHYNEFFNKIFELLKDDGVALVHAIFSPHKKNGSNPWITKYIFPGGCCPLLSEVMPAIEQSKLFVTDIEILYDHYAETLKQWHVRFAGQRAKVEKIWGKTFFRMWDFYLAFCEVAFRHKRVAVFQIQLAKNPNAVPMTRDYIV